MCQNCLKSHCLNQKKVSKEDSDLKNKGKEKNKLLPTDSENKVQYLAKMCQKGQRCYFSEPTKKVNQKDSE